MTSTLEGGDEKGSWKTGRSKGGCVKMGIRVGKFCGCHKWKSPKVAFHNKYGGTGLLCLQNPRTQSSRISHGD